MKIQKQYFYVLLSLIAVSGVACSNTPAPTTNANANQAVVTNSNANLQVNTAATPSPAVSPAAVSAGSPAATVAAYQQAMFKKDEAGFRKVLSSATLREISAEATAEGQKNLVVFWTELSEAKQPTIETRNERIAGDAAYIETKNAETGKWSLNKLVRENGEWKMDLTSATAGELLKQQK